MFYVLLCQLTVRFDVNHCFVYWFVYVLHLFYVLM